MQCHLSQIVELSMAYLLRDYVVRQMSIYYFYTTNSIIVLLNMMTSICFNIMASITWMYIRILFEYTRKFKCVHLDVMKY